MDIASYALRATFHADHNQEDHGNWANGGGSQWVDQFGDKWDVASDGTKSKAQFYSDTPVGKLKQQIGLRDQYVSGNTVWSYVDTERGQAGVDLKNLGDNEVEIHWLTAEARGAGRAAMEKIVSAADTHRITLRLWSLPLPGQGENEGFTPTQAQLNRFYESFGFKKSKKEDGVQGYARKPAKGKNFHAEHDQSTHGNWANGGSQWVEPGDNSTEGLDPHGMVARVRRSGGFTYQPVMQSSPKKGYALSIRQDREEVFDGVPDEGAFASFVNKNADLFKSDPTAHIGAWYDPDANKTYLDVSVIVQDRNAATALAQQHNQEGMYDLETGQTIITKAPERRRHSDDSRAVSAGRFAGSDGGSHAQSRRAAPQVAKRRRRAQNLDLAKFLTEGKQ